jgi:hypothetical protein
MISAARNEANGAASDRISVFTLLDRSGSMADRWDEACGAIDSYVMADDEIAKSAVVTLAVFDSGDAYQIVRDAQTRETWRPVTHDGSFGPRGATPLYDAIGRMVAHINAKAPAKAALVIVTDGLENASREIDRDKARKLLDDCRARGWQVVFLGVDFDAFNQAADVGLQSAAVLNTIAGHYTASMGAVRTRTIAYAERGAEMSFTDEDRATAAGNRKEAAR